MNILYNIIIPKLSTFFCVICDHVTVTVTYDVIITSNSKSKIGKTNENKSSLLFLALTYLIVDFIL